MNWSRADLNAILVEIKSRKKRKTDIIAEKLSSRLGLDVQSLKKKILELEAKERIRSIAKKLKRRG